MSHTLDELKHFLDQCTEEERAALLDYLKARLPQHPLEKEWGVGAEVILSAISRSSDLTKRGVRGIIAEAVFERNILAALKGWEAVRFEDDRPYDFLLRGGGKEPREARIQVKLQRMRRQQPMLASEAKRHYSKEHYVVEVQKTRGGLDLQTNEDTRPYRFGEFDILAVNMHPSTKNWNSFFYTLSEWLLPRHPNAALIEIFQPVPSAPSDVWTESLATCLDWLIKGEKKRILDIAPELLARRARKPREKA
jgi:hypothetical protein